MRQTATDSVPVGAASAPQRAGQGKNSVVVRQYNERVVLSALRRHGEASKAELARHTDLTENTVGLIVRDLMATGLVRETRRRFGARGQPAMLLTLDPDGLCAIGIKLGRRSFSAALIDFGGTIHHLIDRERALPDPAGALEEVRAAIAEIRDAVPALTRGRIAGIGLSIPDNLACWRRALDLADDARDLWADFDFVGALRAAVDLPVFAENDGTAVAVAELFQGYGRDHDDFVSLYIDWAIGGGVVLNGDYRRGKLGHAGDIGLMPTSPSQLASAPEPDGPFDLLMTRASIGSLVRHLRANGLAITSRADLQAAIGERKELLDAWLEDCAQSLVRPLQSIGAVLDVEAILIDGDLDASLLQRLVARVRTLMAGAAVEARQPPDLVVGTIGRNAAVTGAAILPIHLAFRPDQRLLFGTAA